MARDILAEIIERRKSDIEKFGLCQGFERPKRTRPLHDFIARPGTILEVKRASPSKGDIARNLDPAETARAYALAGTSAISVLTETNYFLGSLKDLTVVTENAPDCAVLRKDFLLYPEEVDVAYDFGADAVLLIARILGDETLRKMAGRARELGMTPFVEVRTQDDLRKLSLVQKDGATVAGINARDLRNFHIDPLVPAAFRKELGPRAVFESGVHSSEDAALARRLGFEGVLIGETAAKSPETAKNLVRAFLGAHPDRCGKFWRNVAERREEIRQKFPAKSFERPLVKVCGMTNPDDALLAAELGADLLGFVLCKKSPRSTNVQNIRETVKLLREKFGAFPLTVGVVADKGSDEERAAVDLAKEGVLDAVQFHGYALPAEYGPEDFGRFTAKRLQSASDVEALRKASEHAEPRILIDAFSPDAAGGTGKRIADDLVLKVQEKNALWLAGGISPENIREICEKFSPELVDLSSSLEASHGIKDADKLKQLFGEL